MDHCVSRLLHVLLPLLAKHCPEGLQGATPLQVRTSALLWMKPYCMPRHYRTPQRDDSATGSTSETPRQQLYLLVCAILMVMLGNGLVQVAEATRMLPHDTQLSVMEDIGRYCAACESSKRQKAEIPFAWANKLNSTLKQQGCSASGQSTGPSSSSHALGAQPDDLDGFQVPSIPRSKRFPYS